MVKNVFNNRFVPLMSDAGFKAVFAYRSNKDLLIGLLNHLLPEDVVVKDIVEYCDREQQQDTVESKRAVLDLICRGDGGKQFIVEVQQEFYRDFFQRLVYYGSGVYHLTLDSGAAYGMLRPVYVISILNHKLAHKDESQWDSDNLIARYEFMETRTKELAVPTISINLAELGRFTKRLEECESERDYLFYWFLHGGTLESIPEEIERGSGYLRDLAKATELASMDKDQRLQFESEIMNEIDRIYQLDEKFREGREEGARENSVSVAKKLIGKGISIDVIAECTGLSIDEINQIQ